VLALGYHVRSVYIVMDMVFLFSHDILQSWFGRFELLVSFSFLTRAGAGLVLFAGLITGDITYVASNS
jgi:hypothetical protein